jgi:hypothetical protein
MPKKWSDLVKKRASVWPFLEGDIAVLPIAKGFLFSRIAGSSVCAIIGELYCQDIMPKEILKILNNLNYFSFYRPALNWQALLT